MKTKKEDKSEKSRWTNIAVSAITSVLFIFAIIFVLDRSNDNIIIKANFIKDSIEKIAD